VSSRWPRALGSTFAIVLVVGLTACSTVSTTDSPRREAWSPPPPDPAARGHRIVQVAMQHLGAPYRWGGASPSGFDCSGFVSYVYAQVGVALPRSAAMQYEAGTPVPRDRLRPGDLVFFDRLRHNGIYIGEGRFIHSRQSGKRVGVGSLDGPWYRSRWVGARRP
jgi:cell wall-associated NlpC family hydrolase